MNRKRKDILAHPITSGYTAPDLAGLPPKCSAAPRTSRIRPTLSEIRGAWHRKKEKVDDINE